MVEGALSADGQFSLSRRQRRHSNQPTGNAPQALTCLYFPSHENFFLQFALARRLGQICGYLPPVSKHSL
jgi:hypothetical protein